MSDYSGGLDDRGGLPVDRSDGYSRSYEHAVWSFHRGVASSVVRRLSIPGAGCTVPAPAALPRRCALQAQPAPTRDHVATSGGMVGPDCDGVLKFQLSIINRLIHNQLSIMEKFESSILNSLPHDFRAAHTLNSFKRRLKTHLLTLLLIVSF